MKRIKKFKIKIKMKKSIALFVVSIENSKILEYHTYFEKKLVLSTICNECGNEDEKNI